MEKCNRDNPRSDPGLFQQQRGTAVRNCIQACPKAGAADTFWETLRAGAVPHDGAHQLRTFCAVEDS
jgi:hypothetical protein